MHHCITTLLAKASETTEYVWFWEVYSVLFYLIRTFSASKSYLFELASYNVNCIELLPALLFSQDDLRKILEKVFFTLPYLV